MKRGDVIRKIQAEAKRQGLSFYTEELKKHTALTVGDFRSTIGRHNEVPEGTARAYWKQFEVVLGKGWWR